MKIPSLSQLFIPTSIILIVFNQYIFVVQAGNCFNHRANDICFDLSEADTTEELCTGLYYSDDSIKELDGYVYAENCRNVNVLPKQCDFYCGLGQECQWIDGVEMCVCSEESCNSSSIEKHSVCASNNMTFSSECAMEAWKCLNYRSALYKKYDGECRKDCQDVKCPNDKVCVLVQNTGEPICYPRNHCNPILNPEPVCGTNGITYSNICSMRLSRNRKGQTTNLAHRGPCEDKCRPDLCDSGERCVYSKQLRPVCIRCRYPQRFFMNSGECSVNISVCGDNGQLYKSYCSLLRTRCEKNQYIEIISYDGCPIKKRKNHSRNEVKYSN